VTGAPLEAVRAALAGEAAWLVGGAVRDALLGRATADLDIALVGDPRPAAQRLARTTRAARFPLSDAFGGWRVVAHDHAWNVDLLPLRGGSIEADLASRDFTVNAMAEPVGGGELLDPHGGRDDLTARRLRVVGPGALADDPLRTLRAVRLAVELDLEIEPDTGEQVAAHAGELDGVAPERTFAELKRIVAAPEVRRGVALMDEHGLTAVVLPEVDALRGVEQNVFHHADVHDHTLEVLDAVVAIAADPAAAGLGPVAGAVAALLAEPLADGLTRGEAMRFAALLHDAAKPQTRGHRPDGRVTFVGHDSEGAELAIAVLRRLRASQKLAEYVAALTRHHLRLGFLVHERPLSRRQAWRYLRATEPVAADVTILTVADRLATRGRNAEPAITAHLGLANEMLALAFAERAAAPEPPLLRGDELLRELDVPPGPRVGELLAQLAEDRYAGEIATREDALRRARELLTG
jgi:putative nucleotidyltransferase with HDIG domain